MNSILIYQTANDLIQKIGSRDIDHLAESCGMNIEKTYRIRDALGFFIFRWERHIVLINQHLDIPTQQMVCGYALGRHIENRPLFEAPRFRKMYSIDQENLYEYESNALSSHLMLDSREVYKLTKQGYDAREIAIKTERHINLILIKLLEMYRLGYNLRHYYAQHHAFIERFKFPTYYRFDYVPAE